jgi:hypothetical protein
LLAIRRSKLVLYTSFQTYWNFEYDLPPNGLRYLRWGGDGEAVQPEKGYGVENCLRLPQNPQRQVHALLARSCCARFYML